MRKARGRDTYIDEYVRIAEQRLKGEIAASLPRLAMTNPWIPAFAGMTSSEIAASLPLLAMTGESQ